MGELTGSGLGPVFLLTHPPCFVPVLPGRTHRSRHTGPETTRSDGAVSSGSHSGPTQSRTPGAPRTGWKRTGTDSSDKEPDISSVPHIPIY